MAINLLDRDPSDPLRRAVELAQRGRMILDVATVDLEAAEQKLGPFHPTSWHFRQALAEANRSWDRLRAEFGGATVEWALSQPPITFLTLGGDDDKCPPVVLIPIAGQTYRAERIAGTPLAPTQWRLTRLSPPLEHGPYYACRLRDGSTQCDCAEWAYRDDSPDSPPPCKHLAALVALGWI
jgi:hypothetical protein